MVYDMYSQTISMLNVMHVQYMHAMMILGHTDVAMQYVATKWHEWMGAWMTRHHIIA